MMDGMTKKLMLAAATAAFVVTGASTGAFAAPASPAAGGAVTSAVADPVIDVRKKRRHVGRHHFKRRHHFSRRHFKRRHYAYRPWRGYRRHSSGDYAAALALGIIGSAIVGAAPGYYGCSPYRYPYC